MSKAKEHNDLSPFGSQNSRLFQLRQGTIYYCFDALCGWCYGFGPVMKMLEKEYKDQLAFDVLSGGMIMPDNAQPIAAIAKYIGEAYKNVERLTGVKFGQDYLWHILNPQKSDWVLDSEKPAIALSILKEQHPYRAIEIAFDLQRALMFEGRDLTDNEAYRHLLAKYEIDEQEFYTKLKSEDYFDKAHNDFALVKQLRVKSYPSVLLQVTDSKFYLLATGFATFDTLKERIDKVLEEVE